MKSCVFRTFRNDSRCQMRKFDLISVSKKDKQHEPEELVNRPEKAGIKRRKSAKKKLCMQSASLIYLCLIKSIIVYVGNVFLLGRYGHCLPWTDVTFKKGTKPKRRSRGGKNEVFKRNVRMNASRRCLLVWAGVRPFVKTSKRKSKVESVCVCANDSGKKRRKRLGEDFVDMNEFAY